MLPDNSRTLFAALFEGNPTAHYSLAGGYSKVDGPITDEELDAHLRGVDPSVLSIPILPDGNAHFGAIDVDRHLESDPPVDHAALATQITRLGLPLVVARSKSPRSAHLWLFLKESAGAPASLVRRLLERYLAILAIPGEVEIFPKQEELKEGQIGNGINLPLFGAKREAFGPNGETLDLAGFLELAQSRRSYAALLANRDLAAQAGGENKDSPGSTEERALPIAIIRELHEKNLGALRAARPGTRNDTLNTVAFFAARAFAAKALEGDEKTIKDAIRKAALSVASNEQKVAETLERGWRSGVSRGPLAIFDPESERLAAIDRLTWIDDQTKMIPTLEEALRDLALLTEEEYAQRRATVAKRLAIKASDLDRFVAKRRPHPEDELKKKTVVVIEDTEPWHEPVDGVKLFDELARTFVRYSVLENPADAVVLALWAAGTHCQNLFNIFPRLGVTSPEKECGKTTVLGILEHLSVRAQAASNLTAPVVFRIIELYHPTLLIDEMDTFIDKNPELIGVLNSGHKKGATVMRCEKINDEQVVCRFATYGAVAYGMIGVPAGTLLSRTLLIQMHRKDDAEGVEDLDVDENPTQLEELNRMRRQLARWVIDHAEKIREQRPNTMDLSNRLRDNWRPMLKIADVVGPPWDSFARRSATIPLPKPEDSDQVRVLRDIRNILFTRKVNHIPSWALVADLLNQKSGGWDHYRRDNYPLDERDLSRLLLSFSVRPKSIALSKDEQDQFGVKNATSKVVRKGYARDQFVRIFAKYLAGEEAEDVDIVSAKNMF